MAQSKCVQIDEQLAISKARADREDKLHSLQVQKLELEISMLKEKDRLQKETEKREAAAHELDMKTKEAQLKLIFKQLQEEWCGAATLLAYLICHVLYLLRWKCCLYYKRVSEAIIISPVFIGAPYMYWYMSAQWKDFTRLIISLILCLF